MLTTYKQSICCCFYNCITVISTIIHCIIRSNCYARKSRATHKCRLFDIYNTCRNFYACNIGATRKCRSSYTCNIVSHPHFFRRDYSNIVNSSFVRAFILRIILSIFYNKCMFTGCVKSFFIRATLVTTFIYNYLSIKSNYQLIIVDFATYRPVKTQRIAGFNI